VGSLRMRTSSRHGRNSGVVSKTLCFEQNYGTESLLDSPFRSAALLSKLRGLNFTAKIVGYTQLPEWRAEFAKSGKKLVVTNGCFDLLHLGHVTYLETARNLGGALLVGVNGDDAVRGLKGAGRPINQERDRAAVIAALESVTAACIFPDVLAANFLALARPDIYVKGGDYTLETLNQEERRIVENGGGKIVIIPFVPGKSTTSVFERLRVN
jgi:D-glycero-beta-D-manno-heptose 1-phosphate adenylyltransferase